MTDIIYKYFNKLHNLLNEEENDNMKTVSKEYKDSLQEKIDALQRELDSLKVKEEWYDTKDSIIFKNDDEKIVFGADYADWKFTKDNSIKEYVLFIDVCDNIDGYGNENTASTSISLEQMIQLRDYLTHKIEYLQS